MKSFLKRIIPFLVVPILVPACLKYEPEQPEDPAKQFDNVMIFCAAAYNNLSSDILTNIKTICSSPMPMADGRTAVLLFTHNSKSDVDYSTPTSPYIIRVTSDWGGFTTLDTLKTFSEGAFLTDKSVLREGLEYIYKTFPSKRYGLVYSSHGTGWLPENFYDSPKYTLRRRVAGELAVKSIGCEGRNESGQIKSYEMELADFAASIPFHLNYIIFDACLMGGIETVYELRDKADYIVASQTEVLSTGFDYRSVSSRLLVKGDPDLVGFCRDYFNRYNSESGTRRSATISLVACNRLEGLAAACRYIFSKYRNEIASVNPAAVQEYYRDGHHWFYDLEDILVQSGVNSEDMETFRKQMSECILYKAATPSFMSIKIDTHCGLSSYLPSYGTNYLDTVYQTLEWNRQTGFVLKNE